LNDRSVQNGYFRFFNRIEKARFISRPNRFIVICETGGKKVEAFLPNPGRLMELLLPDATLFLERSNVETRKTSYTAVAVERDGVPVMVHTHRTNDVAQALIMDNLIPQLAGSRIIRREVKVHSSRLDFLLEKGGAPLYLEVKSCTLFGKNSAMFPDAVTARGKRHVEELIELGKSGNRCAILFVIQWVESDIFSPDYHTDIEFAKTFLSARGQVMLIPAAVSWKNDLTLKRQVKILKIPWDTIEQEAKDRGSYLLICRLNNDAYLEAGKLGTLHLRKGFYVYVGSGKKDLLSRINRHRRKRKKMFWHIDYLLEKGKLLAELPVRTRDDIECLMANSLRNMAAGMVNGFGSSDCACPSHLFYFPTLPLSSRDFQELVQYFRMDRIF
jgi:sugar fermentation stimulation protein A